LDLSHSSHLAWLNKEEAEIMRRHPARSIILGVGALALGLAAGVGTATRAHADPSPGRQVHLPVLNFLGQDDICKTWIEAQNLGFMSSKITIVTWGQPGFCPPQAAGPLKVECSGLLVPGASWNFLQGQVPTGAKSGIAFSFTCAQLSDLGLSGTLGFDDVVADYLCETLFFNVVGDSDDYRRFKKAYNEGLNYQGIPMALAYGSPFGVEVLRHCPGDLTPASTISSKYEGLAGFMLGAPDPVYGGFGYYVPVVYADKGGFNSVVYVQNGGLECSSIELWFKAQDDCLRARICEVLTIAPGETFQFDAADCVGPDWQGSAWIRASEPMGIVVDIVGRDILMSYIGKPAQFSYVFEEHGRPRGVEFRTGSQVAYGPLIYSEYQGWDSGVTVQNLSPATAAKVKVYFLDRSGGVITTLVDWVCARGSQTFFLPVIATLPGAWVGSVRVESQDFWSPGSAPIGAPDIQAVATLLKYNDAARSETVEGVAYNLIPEFQAYDWQVGPICCPCPGPGCVGVLGVPSFLKDRQRTGVTTELAIQNVVAKPGFTDFALYIYDQNGLLDFVCEKLHAQQVEYIDLANWGFIHPGFKGSAVISATFWEHDVFTGQGTFVNNVVGLAAVSIERTGAVLGEQIPGDEAAASPAFPILDVGFGLASPLLVPRCPGQPFGGGGPRFPGGL